MMDLTNDILIEAINKNKYDILPEYICEDGDDNQQQEEFSKLVDDIINGNKEREIKSMETYNQFHSLIKQIKYQNQDSAKNMDVFVDSFLKFQFILSSIQDEPKAQEIVQKSSEAFVKLPELVQKASKAQMKFSLSKETQDSIKTITQKLSTILKLKGSDEAKAKQELEELKKQFPNAQNAIQAKYDEYKPNNNKQPEQQNNQQPNQ